MGFANGHVLDLFAIAAIATLFVTGAFRARSMVEVFT
jgi:hypothetical protein